MAELYCYTDRPRVPKLKGFGTRVKTLSVMFSSVARKARERASMSMHAHSDKKKSMKVCMGVLAQSNCDIKIEDKSRGETTGDEP